MPCNSEYMRATGKEIALSQVACLLDELNGKSEINKDHWRGYHPRIYSKEVDGANGITRASLKFRFEVGYRDHPTVMVVFRGQVIWRVDLAPLSYREPNPADAHRFGLPPELCGPHMHNWDDNKEFVAINGYKDIPYKRPLPPQVRKLPQAFFWLSDQIGIIIEPRQRGFDLPPQTELVLRGRDD